MKLVSFIAIFGSVTISMLAFLKPESPRVLTSLSASPRKLPAVFKAAAGVFHFVVSFYHYYALCLQTSSVFLFAHEITPAIRQLLDLSRENRVKFHVLVHNYRSLAVLQANYASVYCHWIPTMQLVNFVTVILNLYLAVVGRNIRAFVLAFTVGTGFCWTLKQLAGVYEASMNVLGSWERRREFVHKLGQKFLKSCRPISIPVGSFFFVDRQLILTVLSIIINSAATLILTKQ